MNLEKWWVLASIPTTMPPSLKIHGIVLRGTEELSNLLQLSIAQNAMAYKSYELCACYMRERKRYAVCILLTSCRLKANAKQTRWSEKDTCEISQQQQQQPHTHTHTGEGKPYFIFETRHNIDKTNSEILFSNVLSRCFDGGAAPTLGHAKGYPEIYTLCK